MSRKPPHPVLCGPQRVWKELWWLLREGALDKAIRGPTLEEAGLPIFSEGQKLPHHMETCGHTCLYTDWMPPTLHRAPRLDRSQDTDHNQHATCRMNRISSPPRWPPRHWAAGGPYVPNMYREEGRSVHHPCFSPSSSPCRRREEPAVSLRLKFYFVLF